jgi:putative ABC transport system permease protein
MEIAADFLEIAKTKRAFGYVFLLVIMLIASIGIFNTVLMSIYERIREVGVMRAFGFTPSQLTTLFILEGFITGIFGAVLGIAAGLVVNAILVFYGYPLDMFGEMGDFPIWGTIYGEWNISTYVIIFIFCVLTATLAGLIPARKAGKMEITQALRFV